MLENSPLNEHSLISYQEDRHLRLDWNVQHIEPTEKTRYSCRRHLCLTSLLECVSRETIFGQFHNNQVRGPANEAGQKSRRPCWGSLRKLTFGQLFPNQRQDSVLLRTFLNDKAPALEVGRKFNPLIWQGGQFSLRRTKKQRDKLEVRVYCTVPCSVQEGEGGNKNKAICDSCGLLVDTVVLFSIKSLSWRRI